MNWVRLSLTLVIPLVLACTSAHRDDPLPQPNHDSTTAPVGGAPATIMATFTCEDSTQIYAIFRTDSAGKSAVSLALGEERLVLPQTISADGARYADSSTVFWNKGKQATFEHDGKTRHCAES